MIIKNKLKTWCYLGFSIILISGILDLLLVLDCRGSPFCFSISIYLDPRFILLHRFAAHFLIIIGCSGLIITFIVVKIRDQRETRKLEEEYARRKKNLN